MSDERRRIIRYGWRPSLPDARDLQADVGGIKVLPEVDPRGDMPKPYDQGQLGCHDDSTEVLTEHGWRAWTDYEGDERLGTVDPLTKRLEFQSPTHLHAYDYNGPLHYGEHQSLNFAVTPNHRMWVRKWNERDRGLEEGYGFTSAAGVGWYAGLLATPMGANGRELEEVTIGRHPMTGDDFVALVACVLADGWVGGTESNRNVVSFCCFREDRRGMNADLADRIGMREVPSRRGVWKFTDPQLAQWFRESAYEGDVLRSPFKRIPQVIMELGERQVALFLSFYGDQHIGASRQFYTTSRGMADGLQALLLKVGKRAGIYRRGARSSSIDGRDVRGSNDDFTVTEWNGDRLSISRKQHMGAESYNGPVFCATVPNGLLVTRRDGQVLVSGNSCTANAIAGAIEYDNILSGDSFGTPSRLDIYYGERTIEGTVNQDSGAYGRDGFKFSHTTGVIPETDWPYDIAKFKSAPPQDTANRHKIGTYKAVTRSVHAMKAVLSNRQTIAFGFTVYESFESNEVDKTGIVPMPSPGEKVLGGHEVLIVGYLKSEPNYALVRNSWNGWGLSGYCLFPWAYVLDHGLASDFRTITRPLGK